MAAYACRGTGIIVLIFPRCSHGIRRHSGVSVITCTRYIRLQGMSLLPAAHRRQYLQGGLAHSLTGRCLFCRRCCSGIRHVLRRFLPCQVFLLCERCLCTVIADSRFQFQWMLSLWQGLRFRASADDTNVVCSADVSSASCPAIFSGCFISSSKCCQSCAVAIVTASCSSWSSAVCAGGVRYNVRRLCVVRGASGCLVSDAFRLLHLLPGRHRLAMNVTGVTAALQAVQEAEKVPVHVHCCVLYRVMFQDVLSGHVFSSVWTGVKRGCRSPVPPGFPECYCWGGNPDMF